MSGRDPKSRVKPVAYREIKLQ